MVRMIKFTSSQQRAFDLIEQGKNVFVTGSAGTGKSFLIKQIREKFSNVVLTSTTGVSAYNIEGTTIHSWSKINTRTQPMDKIIKRIRNPKFSEKLEELSSTQILVIDEISMLDGNTFDYLNEFFKKLFDSSKFFAGIQVIVVGDFFQLPPISKTNYFDDKQGKMVEGKAIFAFESKAWQEAKFNPVLLLEPVRQMDPVFYNCLDRIRWGDFSNDLNHYLNKRVANVSDEDDTIRLYPRNKCASEFNLKRYRTLTTEKRFFASEDVMTPLGSFEFNELRFATFALNSASPLEPDGIELKIGSRVMLRSNVDIESGLCNGAIGVVVDFVDGIKHKVVEDSTSGLLKMEPTMETIQIPKVEFDNGAVVKINEVVFGVYQHTKTKSTPLAYRVGIPLILAWAISIHKSQGLTFDNVAVDQNSVFEDGQSYVALSRVKTYDGLLILNQFNPRRIHANQKVYNFYYDLYSNHYNSMASH